MDIQIDLVIAQVINFLILITLFKVFLGNYISKEIEKRRELLKKIKGAEDEYNKIIELAKKQKQNIIEESHQQKESIIRQGEILANKESQKILDTANDKANEILKGAEKQGGKIQEELKNNRENAVKQTSKMLIKKIIGENVEIQEKYLENISKL
ncbi:hypothetical protein K9M48_01435 [Candidatus Gracilibacteria bacterium]|nr:hypothetical protein [Candidatus Gracilibacteria bacterium]